MIKTNTYLLTGLLAMAAIALATLAGCATTSEREERREEIRDEVVNTVKDLHEQLAAYGVYEAGIRATIAERIDGDVDLAEDYETYFGAFRQAIDSGDEGVEGDKLRSLAEDVYEDTGLALRPETKQLLVGVARVLAGHFIQRATAGTLTPEQTQQLISALGYVEDEARRIIEERGEEPEDE